MVPRSEIRQEGAIIWRAVPLQITVALLLVSLCSLRLPTPPMADFTKEWIEHLKTQISGRMKLVEDKVDPQTYDELVTDLAWFTFRFARDPDTKMRKVFR
jgi:hypothetical protein